MSSFEQSETINENEIKEDFLEVDPKIPGQNFVCLSFVSPEKVLKQKEVFFTTKFLEHFFNSEDQYTKDTRENLMKGELKFDYNTIKSFYDDWKYTRNEVLDDEYYKMNDYNTTIRGMKVRGVYDTQREATVRSQILRRKDPSFNVFIGQVGYWLPWDPECEQVPEQEYQEDMLNDLVKKYKDNLSKELINIFILYLFIIYDKNSGIKNPDKCFTNLEKIIDEYSENLSNTNIEIMINIMLKLYRIKRN